MVYQVAHPFNVLRQFQQALDTQRQSNWFGHSTSGSGTYPAVNAFSQDDDVILVAELPGVEKSTIKIDVKGDHVRIQGEKAIAFEDNVSVHRRERRSGKFDRTVTVPIQIAVDNVVAEYKNGVLLITLPRAAADKPRSIDIN